jgi:hypothetical protein
MGCLDLSGYFAPLDKIVDLEVPRSSRGGGTIDFNGLHVSDKSIRYPAR